MTGLQRMRGRWARSERSATPEEASQITQVLGLEQPGFWTAVQADAVTTARFRGEHHRFRNRLDAAVQVVRLCVVTDAFLAQVAYRARVRCRGVGIPLVPWLLHRVSVVSGQLSIGDYAVLRPGIYIPHGQVVIDGLTLVESGVALRPFVTLGLIDGHIFGPTLGAGALIGTGAKVVGPVHIGQGANIGANAVVVDDIPAHATAVGVPARVLAPPSTGGDA